MGHGIESTDRVFTTRQPAWHGLADVLDDYPTREQAQKLAHDWEPVTEPLYRRVVDIEPDGTLRERFEDIETHVLNVRSDNAAQLGVVSTTRENVLNATLYDVAEALEGPDVRIETGGSLYGGKKVWLLLSMNEPLMVAGDPRGATVPYYGLQNSHDGSGAFRGQVTFQRIICANTSHMADLDAQARGTEFVFRHTKNINERIAEAKDALAGWRESIRTWQTFNNHMLELRFAEPLTAGGPLRRNDEQRVVRSFLEQFIPEPPAKIVSERVRRNIERERGQWEEIYYGITGEGIRGTAYGLLQASIEYAQHFRKAQSKESRFKRAVLDRNALVADAAVLAREAVLL